LEKSSVELASNLTLADPLYLGGSNGNVSECRHRQVYVKRSWKPMVKNYLVTESEKCLHCKKIVAVRHKIAPIVIDRDIV
jgi:hypothetical protein